jgi:serine/threonine protein kinase/Tol biopolymer transport system component
MSDPPNRLTAALADRYRIERELGAGGMATVYLAQDLKHHRSVAIKVLRPELAAVLGADRFVQEITTTAQLQHPHILPLFDSGQAVGFLYYVMPYIEGETLRTKLDREHQLGIEEAVKITTEVADALDYAHRHGVIHRDIKPENILLHDGRPMVADFGIALAVSAAAGGRMTETGLSLGTPHYMSPEQATAEKEITGRSDIYSLASVLYEMLTGNPPHVGSSAQQIIMKIVTDAPRPVTELRKSVPPNVAAALGKALEKLPADRFDSAKSFVDALANPTFRSAAAPSLPSPTAQPSFRLTALLAAAAVVFAALAFWGWHRRTPPPRATRLRIVLTQHPIPAGDIGKGVALSPDGATIAFSDSAGGVRQLWRKPAGRPDAEPLSGTVGAIAATFSPDGDWIAFIADGKLRKIPAAGGSAVTVADSAVDREATPPSVAWLDDGTIIYTNSRFGLSVVPSDGAARRTFDYLTTVGGIASVGALRRGGQALVGVCGWGCPTARMFIVDLATGALDTLIDGAVRGWQLDDGRVVFVNLDGSVSIAPLDQGKGRFTAPPSRVVDGISGSRYIPDLAVSRNGTLLYALGATVVGAGSRTEAVWVTRDGQSTAVDSSWIFQASGNGGIRLSPDGRRLAVGTIVDGREEVWVKQLDHGPLSRLTVETTSQRPEWSGDSRDIWYVAQLNPNRSEVRRTRADGSGSPELILSATRAVWEVLTLPDTNRLLVRLGLPPTRDIYLFDRAKGNGDTALTPLVADDRYEENSVALSPDHRWLAYASNESGRYEVYVRPFPDVDAGRWPISVGGGNAPRWAHSGRELFYLTAEADLAVVAVTTQPTFSPGPAKILFSTAGYVSNTATANYDVSPDDRRFVFLRPRGGSELGARSVILAQHWLDDLTARNRTDR